MKTICRTILSGRIRESGWMVLAWVTMMLPASVWAQSGPGGIDLPAPTVGGIDDPKHWKGYLISFLLFALVMLLSLKPAKRGHQD